MPLTLVGRIPPFTGVTFISSLQPCHWLYKVALEVELYRVHQMEASWPQLKEPIDTPGGTQVEHDWSSG